MDVAGSHWTVPGMERNAAVSLSEALNALPGPVAHVVAQALCLPPEAVAETSASDAIRGSGSVRGWFCQRGAGSVVVWLVQEKSLARVEVADQAALTVTVPLSRVSRVVDAVDPSVYRWTVELDSEARAVVNEGSRLEFVRYDVVAQTAPEQAQLASFSSAVRSLLRK